MICGALERLVEGEDGGERVDVDRNRRDRVLQADGVLAGDEGDRLVAVANLSLREDRLVGLDERDRVVKDVRVGEDDHAAPIERRVLPDPTQATARHGAPDGRSVESARDDHVIDVDGGATDLGGAVDPGDALTDKGGQVSAHPSAGAVRRRKKGKPARRDFRASPGEVAFLVRRMEGSTRDPRSLSELLVQSSVDGIAVIDLDGRYTLWNRAMGEVSRGSARTRSSASPCSRCSRPSEKKGSRQRSRASAPARPSKRR